MVKKSKQRGRPRSFDETEALEAAMKVFWAKGYDGATIDDLVDGMGVRRPSVYAIFGDKATLFMRCLENYGMQLSTHARAAMSDSADVHGAIHGLLKVSVENATREGFPLGCLMVCVAPVVEDERVRDYLLRMGALAAGGIERRFEESIAAGELPADFPSALRARQTLDLSRGLSIRARLGVPRDELLADAAAAAALLIESH